MSRFRFTIGALLGLVVLAAVAIAALREATESWDAVAFTAALAALLAAVLLAVHRRGRARAYWLGFAVFGWAYLVASLVPPVESRLLTRSGLVYLDSLVPGRPTFFTVTVSPAGGNVRGPGPSQARVRFKALGTGILRSGPYGSSVIFIRIGHSLTALLLGLAGGLLSRRLHDRGPGREERPVDA